MSEVKYFIKTYHPFYPNKICGPYSREQLKAKYLSRELTGITPTIQADLYDKNEQWRNIWHELEFVLLGTQKSNANMKDLNLSKEIVDAGKHERVRLENERLKKEKEEVEAKLKNEQEAQRKLKEEADRKEQERIEAELKAEQEAKKFKEVSFQCAFCTATLSINLVNIDKENRCPRCKTIYKLTVQQSNPVVVLIIPQIDNSHQKAWTNIPQEILDLLKYFDLSSDCESEDIKKAYKKKITQYHPDKVSHLAPEFKVIAEEKTKEINKCYKTLMQWKQG